MQIKLIKEIEIMSSLYQITYDKETDGGEFSNKDATIKVGIRSLKNDPNYTFQIISHEIMEIVMCNLGVRYANARTQENYLFSFNHMEFEIAIRIHAQALSKFIK